MTKKIGNLSFAIKNQTLFIKEYCEHHKGLVIDFGAFPIQCLGVCADKKQIIVTIPNAGDNNEYYFQTYSEHNSRTIVNKISHEIEKILFTETKKQNRLTN